MNLKWGITDINRTDPSPYDILLAEQQSDYDNVFFIDYSVVLSTGKCIFLYGVI
jgi:hypothetical protein